MSPIILRHSYSKNGTLMTKFQESKELKTTQSTNIHDPIIEVFSSIFGFFSPQDRAKLENFFLFAHRNWKIIFFKVLFPSPHRTGGKFPVLLYVATPTSSEWAGPAPLPKIARQILGATGPSGGCEGAGLESDMQTPPPPFL